MDLSTLKSESTIDGGVEYSIIIPAYNEEALLPATLTGVQLAMSSVPFKGEIVVVDNNSTDGTKDIALEYGAKLIFEPHRQIARARNGGARAAEGWMLVFLDADTILPPELLQQAISLLADERFCGGGTLIRFDSQLPFLARSLAGFWNWLSKTAKLAAGSFIFCQARGFHDIGGFDEHIYAAEEITFSRKLKAWGKKHGLPFTIITDRPVITSGRKFHWYSSLQITLLLMLFTLFPFALRNRTLCSFWYRRPSP